MCSVWCEQRKVLYMWICTVLRHIHLWCTRVWYVLYKGSPATKHEPYLTFTPSHSTSLRSRKFIYHNQNFNTLFSLDREQDRPTRCIKEAVHIRKEGHRAMNRDEGSYQLSHAYDRLLDATADRRIKTRKNWVPASSDEHLVMRSKRQNKVFKFWLWYMNFLLRIVIPTQWIYFSTHRITVRQLVLIA